MAISSLFSNPGFGSALTGTDAQRAYQLTKTESATTASLYRKTGSAAALTAQTGAGSLAAKGTSAAVAGGTFAAIDADLGARARYLDDVYLSEESKQRLAGAQSAAAEESSIFDRAVTTAERTGPNGANGNLANDVADILGDIVAFAKNGLTEVDPATAAEDLAASVRDGMVDALAGKLTEAGLTDKDADALAGYLTDRILDGAEAGKGVISLSLQQSATLTASSSLSATGGNLGATGALGVESLQHVGGSLALNVTINTDSGEIAVVQSAAAVRQSAEQVSVSGPLRLDGPASGPGVGGFGADAGNGQGTAFSDDLRAKLEAFVNDAASVSEADGARLIANLLEALTARDDTDREKEAEEDAEKEAGEADEKDTAEAAAGKERDPRVAFGLRVPLPSLALGTDAEGQTSLFYARSDETAAKLTLRALDEAV